MMIIEKSSTSSVGIFAILLLIAAPYSTYSQTAYAVASTGVIVPLYTYPGSTWDTLIEAKNAHPSVPIVAIVNCCNGPGSAQDSSYVAGINNLKAAGITVIGYVDTLYGLRSTSVVTSEIDRWKNWYPNMDGIFFDEMAYFTGYEAYYASLNNYVKSKPGFTLTVGNPGVDTVPSYIGTVDNIIIYESAGLPSISSLIGWHTSYDKNNFSIIPFGVSSLSTTFVNDASPYVGYMYVTNDNLSNPWDSLPPYFGDLVAALDVASPNPSPSPSPSTASITINTVSLTGSPITGLWAEISTGGNTVQTGYTPLSYSVNSGTQYTVAVADYQNYIFDHWEDGSTNRYRTITPTQATTVTAYYNQ